MEEIIKPISRDAIKAELTKDKFVRKSNNAGREIYILTHHDSPETMKEIGRLREVAFRDAGGGTGKAVDIDSYDTDESPFHQLIVWDPVDEEIVGGYRFIEGTKIPLDENHKPISATSKLFSFSDRFIEEYLPHTIELGRSFVQPQYQPYSNLRKGIYSLDNLWDGLGSLIIDFPQLKYFFGKFTMYPAYNRYARDVLHTFLHRFFPDKEELVKAKKPIPWKYDFKELAKLFDAEKYEENYKILVRTLRKNGENIPPLVNAYMNLSETMRVFGTSLNPTFGNVEETGILITIGDIHNHKTERHVSSYK